MLSIGIVSCKGTSPKTTGETGGVYIRYNYIGYNPSRDKRVVVMAEHSIEGQKWDFINTATNDTLRSNVFEKSVFPKGAHLPFDYNYVLDFTDVREQGEYKLVTAGAEDAIIKIKDNPYADLVEAPLHWIRAARCGSYDAIDHKVCHLGDTACDVWVRDGMDNDSWHKDPKRKKKINVVGGWHDAADYLKFSLTIGYADYYLLRSYELAPELFDGVKKYSKTKYNDLLDEAKWGLDFLYRCLPDDSTFVIMVANSDDHNVGYRLPSKDQLDGQRPALCALAPEQMGYAAAALALGARIFAKQGDIELANRYGKQAERIYKIAVSKKATPGAWLNDEVNAFYGDETKADNLELAAGELYHWTNDSYYLKEAAKYADIARGAGWKAWESVNLAAHMNIMNDYKIAQNYIFLDLDEFQANSRRAGNIWGIPMKYVWGGLYAYIGVGAAALEYEVRTGSTKYKDLGTNMIDYLMGYNNWGKLFIALPNHPHSIKDPYSQVYNLQADKFPLGAISEGPGDRPSWEELEHYFGFDIKDQDTYKFNTSDGVYYDNRKDFMCQETTVSGVADGVFMLAMAAKLYKN